MLETVKVIDGYALSSSRINVTAILQSLMSEDREGVVKKFGVSEDEVNASLAFAIHCINKQKENCSCRN